MISLVAAGVGIAMVPASVASLRLPQILYRRLRSPAAVTQMGIAYEKENRSRVSGSFLGVVASVTHAPGGRDFGDDLGAARRERRAREAIRL